MNRKLLIPLIFIAISCLPGCWDLQEVDKLAFATTIGIDRGPGKTVNLSIQVPLDQNLLPAIIGSGGEKRRFFITTINAKTVNQAFDLLETETYRNLVINQNKSIIIGEDAAHQNIKPLLDYLVREPTAPMQSLIFVTDGITAEDVMKLEPVQNQLPGMMFISSGQTITKYDDTFFTWIWKVQQRLIEKTKDPFAPLIKIDQEHKLYVISGLAAFSGSHMAGKLDWREAEILGLVTGLTKAGLITFDLPDGDLTLANITGKTRIKVYLQDKKPFFIVNTFVWGKISEVTNQKTMITTQDAHRFQKIVAKEVQSRITALIKKLQGFNSDIINFGEEFRVQHQEVWKKTDWKRVFPTVPFTVKVKVEIPSDGRFR